MGAGIILNNFSAFLLNLSNFESVSGCTALPDCEHASESIKIKRAVTGNKVLFMYSICIWLWSILIFARPLVYSFHRPTIKPAGLDSTIALDNAKLLSFT
jgi:hypothetical protein